MEERAGSEANNEQPPRSPTTRITKATGVITQPGEIRLARMDFHSEQPALIPGRSIINREENAAIDGLSYSQLGVSLAENIRYLSPS